MNISELFYSIQGEGELTGVPSFFIRLHGCNLNCAWCDTTYASRGHEYTTMKLNNILDAINQYPAVRHIVITGGEPLLSYELPVLTKRLRENDYHITIETNGTLPPNNIICDLASISPKLAHSRNPQTEQTPINISALNQWVTQCPIQLKFVVQSPGDMNEIDIILNAITDPLAPEKILLMPETSETTDVQWIIDICLEKGYRYCHRLQYSLFGNRKGT